jgi:hypothetical protein
MNTILFKHNRSLKTLIKDYKRQNTKGWKGIRAFILEEKGILKYRIQYLWLKYFVYKVR